MGLVVQRDTGYTPNVGESRVLRGALEVRPPRIQHALLPAGCCLQLPPLFVKRCEAIR
jgi:hypothetical protein